MPNAGIDAKSAAQLDEFLIRLTLPVADIQVIPMQVLAGGSSTLQAEATWYSIKDEPYPAPPEPALE